MRRICSLLLAFCLIFTAIPMEAFAQNEGEAVTPKAESSQLLTEGLEGESTQQTTENTNSDSGTQSSDNENQSSDGVSSDASAIYSITVTGVNATVTNGVQTGLTENADIGEITITAEEGYYLPSSIENLPETLTYTVADNFVSGTITGFIESANVQIKVTALEKTVMATPQATINTATRTVENVAAGTYILMFEDSSTEQAAVEANSTTISLSAYAGKTLNGIISKASGGDKIDSAVQTFDTPFVIPSILKITVAENAKFTYTPEGNGALTQTKTAREDITPIKFVAKNGYKFVETTDIQGVTIVYSQEGTNSIATIQGKISGDKTFENIPLKTEEGIKSGIILTQGNGAVVMFEREDLFAGETFTGVRVKAEGGEYGELIPATETNKQIIVTLTGLNSDTEYIIQPQFTSEMNLEHTLTVVTLAKAYTNERGISATFRGNILDLYGDGRMQTTYNNNGWKFENEIQGGIEKSQYVTKTSNNVAEITIVLRNTTGNTLAGNKFAYHADVQIGNTDRAPIYNRNTIGFMMTDNTNQLILCNEANVKNGYNPITGVSQVATLTKWWGKYNERYDNVYVNSSHSDLTNGTDSGAAFSWQNISLAPYEVKVFSYKMGVGKVGESDLDDLASNAKNYSIVYKGLSFEGSAEVQGTKQGKVSGNNPTVFSYTAVNGFKLTDKIKLNNADLPSSTTPFKGIVYTKISESKGSISLNPENMSPKTSLEINSVRDITGNFNNSKLNGIIEFIDDIGSIISTTTIKNGVFTIAAIPYGQYTMVVNAKDDVGYKSLVKPFDNTKDSCFAFGIDKAGLHNPQTS